MFWLECVSDIDKELGEGRVFIALSDNWRHSLIAMAGKQLCLKGYLQWRLGNPVHAHWSVSCWVALYVLMNPHSLVVCKTISWSSADLLNVDMCFIIQNFKKSRLLISLSMSSQSLQVLGSQQDGGRCKPSEILFRVKAWIYHWQ